MRQQNSEKSVVRLPHLAHDRGAAASLVPSTPRDGAAASPKRRSLGSFAAPYFGVERRCWRPHSKRRRSPIPRADGSSLPWLACGLPQMAARLFGFPVQGEAPALDSLPAAVGVAPRFVR